MPALLKTKHHKPKGKSVWMYAFEFSFLLSFAVVDQIDKLIIVLFLSVKIVIYLRNILPHLRNILLHNF